MIEVSSIHPSIIDAICRVQAGMSSVKKDRRNQHGSYDYASTDAIYAAISLKLAEVGLVIMCLEETPPEIIRIEKDGKTSQWGKFTFQFVLATREATWSDPRSRRSLYLAINGPQTFQGAQSFAEKAYMRSLLKIATGDVDLDSLPQSETEEGQISLAKPRKPKSSSSAKKDGTTEVYNEILKAMAEASTVEILQQIPDLYAEEIGTLPSRWHELYEGEYETRMMMLRPQAAE